MEDIQDRVKHDDRFVQLYKLVLGHPDTFIETMAELIEQAYLAGWNRYTPSNGKIILDDNDVDILIKQEREINLEGQPLTMARNYVKDKGFRK